MIKFQNFINQACRVSCGHRFCRYCLDRKRSGDSFKPGEGGTPKCSVCNAAINEVQNLSELDKEIDDLYSKLPMKARLDRAALKTQRERQVDAWKRRPIARPPSAPKPSTSTRPTPTANSSLPFLRRRDEHLVTTPRRNRGIFPERQRSYLDMYRENLHIPQRQRSSPQVQLLFQDTSADIGSSSEEALHPSLHHSSLRSSYELPTSTSELLGSSSRRRSSRRRRASRSTGAESLLARSHTSVNSEPATPVSTSSTSLFRPLVIHETYTIRRTRVLNATNSLEDTFTPQAEHNTETNYMDDTEFQGPDEYPEEEPRDINDTSYRSSEDWRTMYNDLNIPNQRYPQYQSPWSGSNNNIPIATSIPTNLNASLPNWYFGVDPVAYPDLNPRSEYYNFLHQAAAPPPMTQQPPIHHSHWVDPHGTNQYAECPCTLCYYSRRRTSPNNTYHDEPENHASFFEANGGAHSEHQLHSSESTGFVGGGASGGYQYHGGDTGYPEFRQAEGNLGNYDSSLYHHPLMSDESEVFGQYNQSGIDMNMNYNNYGYSDLVADVMESSNYFVASHEEEYYQEPCENNWNQPSEYQNIVDSFYSSNAAAAAVPSAAEEGASATAAAASSSGGPGGSLRRSNRRYNDNNDGEMGPQTHPRSHRRRREFDSRGEITSHGNNRPENQPAEPSNSRDDFDFDEFGPEIAVTEAIIGFRR